MKRFGKWTQRLAPVLAGAAWLAFTAVSEAATYQWTNTTTGAFVDAANWTNTASPFANGVPAAGDTAINNVAGSTTLIGTGDAITVATVNPTSGTVSMTDGSLTASTVAVNGAGVFAVSGGTVSLANLQITGNNGVISLSGGTTTVTTDSRIGAANGVYNVSGGVLNLPKTTLGSAAAGNINNIMTVSGNAVVNQNQSASANRELWIGGNNGGSGTLILKDNAAWTNSALNASTDVIVGRAASSGQTPVGLLIISNNANFVVQAGAAAAKVIRMADNSTAATGTLYLNGGNISTVGFVRGSGTATINVSDGKITALAASANFFNNFTGTGGNNSVNLVAGSLTFDTAGNAVTIANVLSGAGGLTKVGAGALTLSGANTFTGPTVVNGGSLIVTPSSTGASALSVADGALLEVQVSAAGKSLTNASLTLGTSGSLTNVFTLGANGSTSVPVMRVNGALNLNGTVYVNVSGTGLAADTYPLIAYSSFSGAGTFVAVSLPGVAGYSASLVNDTVNKQLKLVYAALPLPSVKWAVGDGAWDTITPNWQFTTNNGVTTYVERDFVTFDDSAAGSSPITVTLSSDYGPTALTNNSSKTYILAGGFNVTNAPLVKSGSGTFILDNGPANTFSSVTINNGVLQVGNGDANGSLGSAAVVDNGSLAFNRADSLAVNNLISGTGGLLQSGSGTLTLSAANTYGGVTTVNNGVLALAHGAAVQNSTLANNVPNGVAFATGITSATAGALSGSGDILLADGASAAVTLTAGGNNASTTYSGSLNGGSGVFQKAGTGTLTLSGYSSLFNLAVTGAGTLALANGSTTTANLQVNAVGGAITMNSGTLTVTSDGRIQAANGVWNLSGGTIHFNKIVVGNGSTTTNALVTVSGDAVVIQDQPASGTSNLQLWIGGNNSGSGTLVLKDNAAWTQTQTGLDDGNGNPYVVVGNNGTGQGTFTLQDNATFYYANRMRLARNTGNVGTVNLNGGTISVTGFEQQAGTAFFNANGGKVVALAPNANFFLNFANAINLQTGGLTLDDSGNAITITNVMAGPGGFTKLNSGTLTLTAAQAYTGATIVNSGTLQLVGAGSLNSSSAITVAAGATLDLSTANGWLATAGALTLSDGNLTANFSTTNVTVGTLGTSGGANTLQVTALPVVTTVPKRVTLIKYTTAAPGLVDGNNVLTALAVTLPTVANPVGYLTNNAANKSIDLVITSMTVSPNITQQPQPDSAYSNCFAHFTVALEMTNAPAYQWRKDGLTLSDGEHVAGAHTAYLKLSHVSVADVGYYDVVITNTGGAVTSSPAPLSLLAPVGYEATALAAGPVALYMFDDQGDPLTNALAFDYAGDFDGVYGMGTQNGNPFYNIAGPRPSDGLIGFDATNAAVRTFSSSANSSVAVPALNLNTNTVTFTAWINPVSLQPANAGVVFCRGAGTVAGLNFTTSVDANFYPTLGYTWNNEPATYFWNSQIAPTPGQWSFVALTVSPTNATIYIFDATGVRASSFAHTHVNQSFSTNTFVGADPFSVSRQFDGSLDGVGIYASALTQSQLEALFLAGKPGAAPFALIVWAQPASQTLYAQQNATFTVGASGSQPMSYQWQWFDGVNYFNVADNGRFSGATTPTLTISSLQTSDATNFVVVVSNLVGAVTSTVATLTVNPVNPAQDITNAVVQVFGEDWNTGTGWSDGNPASYSALLYPGSRYFVVPGGALRTPNTTAAAEFPGNTLTIYGDGTYTGGVSPAAGAVLLKGQSPGVTAFRKLLMRGGQILSVTDDNKPSTIGGEVDILANTAIAGQSSTGGRSITLSATLTGTANVDYYGWPNTSFQPSAVTALNVAGSGNTYSGTWNVVGGTLVGSAPGALGTNNITVGANGALQTTYDLFNPQGSLILNGRMNLTQNDTFRAVVINGVSLPGGTYPYSWLASNYPAHFPATWTAQTGAESFTTASGSLTVVVATPPHLTNSWNGASLTLSWPAGAQLLEATNLLGPWTTNATATSPYTVLPAEPQKFFRLLAQ